MTDQLSSIRDDLYQEVILDHASKPRNAQPLEGAAQTHEHNPLCGDSVTVFVSRNGDTITDVASVPHGCVLSMASASMMTEAARGKSAREVLALCDAVQTMATGGQPVEQLLPLASVAHYPARVKCVVMPWHALKKLVGAANPRRP